MSTKMVEKLYENQIGFHRKVQKILKMLLCFLPFPWFNLPAITTFDVRYRVPWRNLCFFRVLGTESEPATEQEISANYLQEKHSCDYSILPPARPAYFFCVSPAFTRILRTSRIGLVGFGSQFQKDFLKLFQTELQLSASPSQVRRIFNRSPISSSVNTRKVLVRFRPMMPSWLKKGQKNSER